MHRKPPTFKRGVPKLSRNQRQDIPRGAFVAPLMADPADRSKEGEERARLLQTILDASGATVDAPPVYAALTDAFDLWQEREDEAARALSVEEELRFAVVTAEAYQQAADRLRNAPPGLGTMAEGIHWAVHRRGFDQECESAAGGLERLAATWRAVAERLTALPPRSGPVPNPARGMALRIVRDALIRHSTPFMTMAKARAVAAELLAACGMPMPNAPNELRKLERQ